MQAAVAAPTVLVEAAPAVAALEQVTRAEERSEEQVPPAVPLGGRPALFHIVDEVDQVEPLVLRVVDRPGRPVVRLVRRSEILDDRRHHERAVPRLSLTRVERILRIGHEEVAVGAPVRVLGGILVDGAEADDVGNLEGTPPNRSPREGIVQLLLIEMVPFPG